MRRGNMGHLTRIANSVVQNMEKGPMQTHICEFIKGRTWLGGMRLSEALRWPFGPGSSGSVLFLPPPS